MEIKEVKRAYDGECIRVDFVKNGKKGWFIYNLFGETKGILESKYEEDEDEDIYLEMHDWVGEHISAKAVIKYNGNELE